MINTHGQVVHDQMDIYHHHKTYRKGKHCQGHVANYEIRKWVDIFTNFIINPKFNEMYKMSTDAAVTHIVLFIIHRTNESQKKICC